MRVWDYHWISHMEENLTWDLHLGGREGIAEIPLSRVLQEVHLDDTFPLENVDGEIDLELKWIPLLGSP